MSDDMNTKYQQHYNQILSGTLSDTILKTISFQANIKLANEIIAEQEETISELKDSLESSKNEIEELKNNKIGSENSKISALEGNLKSQNETIVRLNSEINNTNRLKAELESLKSQSSNAETFRNQLVKERESHQKTKDDYELQIGELKKRIELLEAPPKKKKAVKPTILVETPAENEQQSTTQEVVRDGGSF